MAKTGETIAFDYTAEALPWVLPPEAGEGFNMTHAGHHFSNEKLTVRDLPHGEYTVQIDGQAVGDFSSGDLAAGVELEGDAKTPEYQQALKVALLNKDRNDQAIRPLRDQWGQMKGQRRAAAKAEAAGGPEADAAKAKLAQWRSEVFQPKLAELATKARAFEDQIYQANQPTAHHFEIAPVAK